MWENGEPAAGHARRLLEKCLLAGRDDALWGFVGEGVRMWAPTMKWYVPKGW